MLDWLVDWFPLLFLFSILGTSWHFLRAYFLHDVPAGDDSERQRRLSRARLRRLRTARYAAEHYAWSEEFHALSPKTCDCAALSRGNPRQ